jgi:sulfide:quinone oxidoreductase
MSAPQLRVVVAGGGVAALEASLALRALAEDRVSIDLLAPETQFWYRPLAVAEPFGLGAAKSFDLPELSSAAGATFSLGALTAVDTERRVALTSLGGAFPYDVLLVACGATPTPAVSGAITFRGPADSGRLQLLLDDLAGGRVRRVAFAVPWGAVWSLPIYELALMTAAHVSERKLHGVDLALVTPEDEPLQLFGAAGSEAVRELLEERGIHLHTGACAAAVGDGELHLLPKGSIEADRVVALPRLRGPHIDGLSQTVEGFLPVDANCRVQGASDVFAAGDVTNFPVKQGGIATQQADAAAEMIASSAGADVAPEPFRPVLRGLLLTGHEPRYLRHQLTGEAGDASTASPEPLWWPPAKIVGRYLSPFLAAVAGVESPPESALPAVAVRIDVPLDVDGGRLRALLGPPQSDHDSEQSRTVAGAMFTDLLVVAPEDTLGEVAEKMREHDQASALVCEFGRLIGVLTARDLLRAFAGRVHPSEARSREWMTADPVTVSEQATIDDAVLLMTEFGFHHLPVVQSGRPIGMLGLRQALRTMREQGAGVEGHYPASVGPATR